MAIRGLFASHQGLVGERTGSFASAVLMTQASGNAPLFAISSGMPDEDLNDTSWTWYEDAHINGRMTCTSGGTTTTVGLTDASFFLPNQVLLVEQTGERIMIDSISGNNLTVARGIGGTAIVSITNAMTVQLIASAFEEGSTKPDGRTTNGVSCANVTQIFRNAWSVTGTVKAVKYNTGDKVANNARQCSAWHAEEMERAMIWGVRHVGTKNTKQLRMTSGLIQQIEQRGGKVRTAAVGSVAGDIDLKEINDWIRDLHSVQIKDRPNERLAFSGEMALQVLNNCVMADTSYQIQGKETEHGISVTEFLTPFGKLKLVTHQLMNMNPFWNREIYAFHPGGIKKRTLRATFEDMYDKSGTRANGVDADEGLMTTEMGVECGAARTMGIYRNLQNAKASTY